MTAHQYDPLTSYCTRCGCGEGHVWTGAWHVDCIEPAENVVAVSHLIAKRRQAALTAKLAEYGLYPDGEGA